VVVISPGVLDAPIACRQRLPADQTIRHDRVTHAYVDSVANAVRSMGANHRGGFGSGALSVPHGFSSSFNFSAPRIESITVEPRVCVAGDAVRLDWSAANAVDVVVRRHGVFPARGAVVVEPSRTGRYELIARGAGGESTGYSPAVLVVDQPRIRLLTAPAPPRQRVGGRMAPPRTAAAAAVPGGLADLVAPAGPPEPWRRRRWRWCRRIDSAGGYGWLRTADVFGGSAVPELVTPSLPRVRPPRVRPPRMRTRPRRWFR
jgi:hypothetical protein